MERGIDREREAVCARWRELARQRRAANRLLLGLVAVGGGVVLLLVSMVGEACLYRPGGWHFQCTSVGPASTSLLLVAFGAAAVGAGLVLCWSAVRSGRPPDVP
jgi:hypothetical protein